MRATFEFDTLQNTAFSSVLIWYFIKGYHDHTEKTAGPPLRLCLLVLPILYNADVVEGLYRRRKDHGLLAGITEDKALTIGLQENVQALSDLTFQALNLGLSAGLLRYVPESAEFIPAPKEKPLDSFVNEANDKMLKLARKLGRWFTVYEIDHLFSLLRVGF